MKNAMKGMIIMKKSGINKKKIIIGIIALFIVWGVVNSNDKNSNDETQTIPNVSDTNENLEISTEIDIPEDKIENDEVEEELSIEETIIQVVKNEFGEDNFIQINYIPDNNFLLIKAKGAENLTDEMTARGMILSISNILKELKDFENINIDFNIVYPMQDNQGNISDDIVIKATYNWDTRKDLDYDGLVASTVQSFADEWWINPVIEKALNN